MTTELDTYRRCLAHQLEELELLSSIYCGSGELNILDAGVVADFNEWLDSDGKNTLHSHLEYIIKLSLEGNRCVDVRIELPHLYPLLELARISVCSTLLEKTKDTLLRTKIYDYLEEQQISREPYVYQLLIWLQEEIEQLIKLPQSEITTPPEEIQTNAPDLERIWIYSHHIKSSAKRQEIMRQAQQMQLTGFSRPGKPGIICVEGLSEQVQEYWRSIKSLRWQKITLVKTEQKQRKRLFGDFRELLFNTEEESNESIMNSGQFIRFLDAHGSGYMKSELFGLN